MVDKNVQFPIIGSVLVYRITYSFALIMSMVISIILLIKWKGDIIIEGIFLIIMVCCLVILFTVIIPMNNLKLFENYLEIPTFWTGIGRKIIRIEYSQINILKYDPHRLILQIILKDKSKYFVGNVHNIETVYIYLHSFVEKKRGTPYRFGIG